MNATITTKTFSNIGKINFSAKVESFMDTRKRKLVSVLIAEAVTDDGFSVVEEREIDPTLFALAAANAEDRLIQKLLTNK